jgi:outer membrane receptor protein involved in Fe transport
MFCRFKFPCGRGRLSALLVSVLALPFAASTAVAQEEDGEDEQIEEIITVGSQIKGANIRDALAVSVVTAADIEDLGVDSGDELLEFMAMAEQGQNFFVESENISGGVNAARGDIGAYNLRNLGTGNTLVLLNGRRMVNAASYQTEAVGGSFIPVNSVNSQSLPVFGLERVEVLRDGASAIYGADAVAGVVNYVMKDDFDGFSIRARYAGWEGLPREDIKLTVEWGNTFNDGRTNLSIFGSFYDRDPVNSQDDPKWADDDFRRLIPPGSSHEGDTSFRRAAPDSEYGQWDIQSGVGGLVDPLDFWDGDGQFNTYPLDSEFCEFHPDDYPELATLYPNVCFAADGNPIYRYNNNRDRDLYSDLKRTHLFAFLNHEFGNGLESFTELSAYISDTFTVRHASTWLGAVDQFRIAPTAYWNPLGECGTTARLPDSIIGTDVPCTGLELEVENYRWTDAPRHVYNDGKTYRFLTGLRGELGSWDWEGAVTWSKAEKEDITRNRISNARMEEAINDTTPAGYNLFSAAIDANVDRALITVRRDNETELKMIDFKMSNGELFELPAGPVGLLVGVDWREESFVDDRDPRLDGTIQWADYSGNTWPFVSDVMNSSPTADSSGSRDVFSAFTEFQVPIFSTLDAQFALRYEDFSDIGDTTVGKVALGWRPLERLLFRGSWSEAYRVPNLVTVNETGVARSNPRDDFVCFFVDPDETLLDCNQSMQRAAGGSDLLIPEESENTSIGVVWDITDDLTVTVDWWSIEKDDTIGLFGEENHTALDLLRLIEDGTGACPSTGTRAPSPGNPAVVRDPGPGADTPEEALFLAAGICPVGQAVQVFDIYQNLDTRKLRGHDIGIYYNVDTGLGDFNIRYVGSRLDEYFQEAGPAAQELLDGQESGTLPADVPVVGFANLVRQDGNPRWKHTARLSWRKGAWGASVSGTMVTDVIETRPGIENGEPWVLDSMATYNASLDYSFDSFANSAARVRLGVVNFTDERAPLASERFGYESDIHRDLPRSWYLDLRLDF